MYSVFDLKEMERANHVTRGENAISGKPPKNIFIERFSRTARCEWLLQKYWQSEEEA